MRPKKGRHSFAPIPSDPIRPNPVRSDQRRSTRSDRIRSDSGPRSAVRCPIVGRAVAGGGHSAIWRRRLGRRRAVTQRESIGLERITPPSRPADKRPARRRPTRAQQRRQMQTTSSPGRLCIPAHLYGRVQVRCQAGARARPGALASGHLWLP